ncbi:MAG TPA: hypothetical protein VEZ11_08355, partial [Thermoanaerobaculia bacterium]|nr:hypothetical protein [Thermoanaerobaculia bacterium]
MKKSLALSLLLSALVVTALQAQAPRTWVSGVGDDVNPCSRTAPCKTFAGAISKTAVGGEIDTLDPGGFGAVTITKAITLDGTQNGLAGGSILVAGTAAIVVNAPSNAVVTIRGLSLNGAGTGTAGINIIAAQAVHVEGCVIFQFNGRGISLANTSGNVSLFVRDSIIRNNAVDGVTSIPAGGT